MKTSTKAVPTYVSAVPFDIARVELGTPTANAGPIAAEHLLQADEELSAIEDELTTAYLALDSDAAASAMASIANTLQRIADRVGVARRGLRVEQVKAGG